MGGIKALIFDLGRVLVDIDFSQGLTGKLGVGDFDSILRLAGDEDFVAYSTGGISPEEFYACVVAKTGLRGDYTEFCRLWCNIFREMPGIYGLVKQLAGRYSLGLLSDTDPLHWNFIRRNYSWIEEYFTRPALSFQLGVMKPDPQAFRAAVELLGMRAEECLFIDDIPQNIAGARDCGLEGILFRDVAALSEELVARGLIGKL